MLLWQVDNFELFLGRRIDVNGDGDISDTERANAKAILKQIKENYVFGLDVRLWLVRTDARTSLLTTLCVTAGGWCKQQPSHGH